MVKTTEGLEKKMSVGGKKSTAKKGTTRPASAHTLPNGANLPLTQEEFSFYASMAFNGGIQNPMTPQEDLDRFTEMAGRTAYLADVTNLVMAIVQHTVQQALYPLVQPIDETMMVTHVLENVLVDKGVVSKDELFEAANKYQEEVLAQVEAQKKEQEEKVIKHESDIDMEVK